VEALTVQFAGRAEGVGRDVAATSTEVFDGTVLKISGFVSACRLYVKMKLRKVALEEQI